MSTTLITNGIVVDAGTMRPLDILISGERVESLLVKIDTVHIMLK